MKNIFPFALALILCLSSLTQAKAQSHISASLSSEGVATFTIRKEGICLLLSQKGKILNLIFNSGSNVAHQNDVEVSYDLHGKVNKLGGTEISYDLHGRIDEIGDNDIDYDLSGRITKIGTTTISYHFSTGNIERIKG